MREHSRQGREKQQGNKNCLPGQGSDRLGERRGHGKERKYGKGERTKKLEAKYANGPAGHCSGEAGPKPEGKQTVHGMLQGAMLRSIANGNLEQNVIHVHEVQ